MQNDQGEIVDLYIPRKCSASNRLIGAKDKSSIQINFCDVDPATGRMLSTNQVSVILLFMSHTLCFIIWDHSDGSLVFYYCSIYNFISDLRHLWSHQKNGTIRRFPLQTRSRNWFGQINVALTSYKHVIPEIKKVNDV